MLSRIAAIVVSIFLCSIGVARAEDVVPELLKTIDDDKLEMQERDAAVKQLVASHAGAQALITLAKDQKLPDELKSSVALACAGCAFEDVRAAAEKAIPLPKTKDGKSLPPINKLVEMTGDPVKGKANFANAQGANCFNCHLLGGVGKEVGPPLDTIGEKPKDVLFESILTPSAAIQHGFDTWMVKTKSGTTVIGILVDENDDKTTLKDIQGEYQEIPAKDIQKKIKQKQSLMPEGLYATMTLQELVDLVEFLSQQKVK